MFIGYILLKFRRTKTFTGFVNTKFFNNNKFS